MTQGRAGFWAAAGAYAIWGLLPLYLKQTAFASPWEVLAQRILWSAPFAALAVAAFRASADTIAALRRPRTLWWLCASAVLVSLNWGLYVWAVANAMVIEASLAYFLTPLVQVAFGVLLFKERLTPLQIAAFVLAAAGVGLQTAAVGALPWVALVLCATWSCYGLIRKRLDVPATGGLLIETALLAPAAGALLWWLAAAPGGSGVAFDDSPTAAALLALAGLATAAPLMMFAYGARRLPFTTLAVLQFIAPTLQFATGLAYGEPFSALRAAGFGVIWLGLCLYLIDMARPRAVATA
jgi:chloramphenicol-sensitive protein RarD